MRGALLITCITVACAHQARPPPALRVGGAPEQPLPSQDGPSAFGRADHARAAGDAAGRPPVGVDVLADTPDTATRVSRSGSGRSRESSAPGEPGARRGPRHVEGSMSRRCRRSSGAGGRASRSCPRRSTRSRPWRSTRRSAPWPRGKCAASARISGSSGPLRTSEPTGSRVRGRSWSQPRRRPPARRCRGWPSPASSQTPRSVSSLPRRRRARTRKAGRRRCSSPPPSATISASVRDAGRPSPGPRYRPVRRGSHRGAAGDRRAAGRSGARRPPGTRSRARADHRGVPGHDPAVTVPPRRRTVRPRTTTVVRRRAVR